MYELSVERVFRASHAIVMKGELEVSHEHDWKVTLVVTADGLDGDGLLCDFHLIEKALDGLLDNFRGRDLNATPPFDRVNPTAELVAKYIADEMVRALKPAVTVRSVSVVEAPGCTATYYVD